MFLRRSSLHTASLFMGDTLWGLIPEGSTLEILSLNKQFITITFIIVDKGEQIVTNLLCTDKVSQW